MFSHAVRILRLSLSSLNLTAWMGPPLKSVFSSSRLMFTTRVQVMRRIKREHQINGRNDEPHKWNDAGNKLPRIKTRVFFRENYFYSTTTTSADSTIFLLYDVLLLFQQMMVLTIAYTEIWGGENIPAISLTASHHFYTHEIEASAHPDVVGVLAARRRILKTLRRRRNCYNF